MIRKLEGNDRVMRLIQCTNFCRFLIGQDCFIRAFNHLPHHQQIIAVLIQENSEEHPHRMKEYYLRTLVELRKLAIARFTNIEPLTATVIKETELGYIAGYFRMRRTLGLYERMAPALQGGAGGGPGNLGN